MEKTQGIRQTATSDAQKVLYIRKLLIGAGLGGGSRASRRCRVEKTQGIRQTATGDAQKVQYIRNFLIGAGLEGGLGRGDAGVWKKHRAFDKLQLAMPKKCHTFGNSPALPHEFPSNPPVIPQ